MKFILEKSLCNHHFEAEKEYTSMNYDEIKQDIESMFGKCSFSVTDIESSITWVKPYKNEDEYRLICCWK